MQSVLTLHEGGHFLELRNAVRPEDTVVLKHLEDPTVLAAGVFGHEVEYRVEDCLPRRDFFGGVVYARDWVAAVTHSQHSVRQSTHYDQTKQRARRWLSCDLLRGER